MRACSVSMPQSGIYACVGLITVVFIYFIIFSRIHTLAHLQTQHKTVGSFAMPEPQYNWFNRAKEADILNAVFNLILHFYEPLPPPQITLRCLES